MKIAIPTAEGKLAMHFGHCQVFTLVDANPDTKIISSVEEAVPPAHEPAVLPKWLSEQGAHMIIAGGMGARAQQFFAQFGIEVVVGAPSLEPKELVTQYLEGSLAVGDNICDH